MADVSTVAGVKGRAPPTACPNAVRHLPGISGAATSRPLYLETGRRGWAPRTSCPLGTVRRHSPSLPPTLGHSRRLTAPHYFILSSLRLKRRLLGRWLSRLDAAVKPLSLRVAAAGTVRWHLNHRYTNRPTWHNRWA